MPSLRRAYRQWRDRPSKPLRANLRWDDGKLSKQQAIALMVEMKANGEVT
jgi:hypothetical protein